tara:strand:- start:41122 stop:42273 length:1152 start_codon:yes stop_codon:yes gene_type:complete
MSATPQNSTRIYFDYNATSPLADGVAAAIGDALCEPGNPSSLHREGRRAQSLVDAARETVAATLEAGALDLIFTSGGTEANHLGLLGLARVAKNDGPVLIAPTVHPSLWAAGQRAGAEGLGVATLAVGADGTLDMAAAEEIIATAKPRVLALSLANHELGCVEDVEAVATWCRAAGCLVFCDAIQGLGRLELGSLVKVVDGISISAHKIGGPKGIGALWLRPGPAVESLIGGGGQESGRRPGTQAVALIAGFAAACEGVADRLADAPRQDALRGTLTDGLIGLGAVMNSSPRGLCNTVNARFPGVPGELLVTGLDLAGIAASTGAACSSGTVEPSSVLLGIGLTADEAMEALRLSIGPGTTAAEVQSLLDILPPILERARRFG